VEQVCRKLLRRSIGVALAACICALAAAPAPAVAQGQTPASAQKAQPSPTVLWEEYPLEPVPARRTTHTALPSLQLQTPDQPGASPSPNWTLLAGGLALVILSIFAMTFSLAVRILGDRDDRYS
jgi:hypothetical protein